METIRVFYDAARAGYHFVRGADEELIVWDGQVAELQWLLNRFFLYSDKIQPDFEELFHSDEIVPDKDPCYRVTESYLPWEWAGTVDRTESIMRTIAETPELIQYSWLEATNEQANDTFEQLKKAVARKHDRRYPIPTCVDGPCEGDMVNVGLSETRVMAYLNVREEGVETRGEYIYEVNEDGNLQYVRTHSKTETKIPFTERDIINAVVRNGGRIGSNEFWTQWFEREKPKDLDEWLQSKKTDPNSALWFTEEALV